jgi:hypothetical protein
MEYDDFLCSAIAAQGGIRVDEQEGYGSVGKADSN